MNIKYHKILLVFCLVCLMPSLISAQSKYDYNWVFMKTIISFHGDTVKILDYENPNTLGSSSVTINNDQGDFLGYTNGCRIYNPDLYLMEHIVLTIVTLVMYIMIFVLQNFI